jgi:hypothetical protein
MAIAEMSPGDQNPVGPHLKRFDKEAGVHASGTHEPDDRHIGRILESAHTGKIRSRVSTPVTRECNDLWIKFFSHT